MNKTQEEAWIFLFLMPIGAAIGGGLVVGLIYVEGMSLRRLLMFVAFAVWCGLFWLWPTLVRKVRRRKTKVVFDERDELICKRATLAGYIAVWVYFVAACVLPLWFAGPQGTILVIALPLILIGGIVVFSIVQNIAILIQYGKGEKNHE